MTERTVEKGYQDYGDCRVYRGEVERLWYPRGNTVVFGVWQHEDDAESGDGQWCEDIRGWSLPLSPPHVELVFPLPECAPALGILFDRDNDPGLKAALDHVLRRCRLEVPYEATKRTTCKELEPSDFHRRPVTEREIATWEAMTPEQRALFGNILSSTFRWVLHVQGPLFQDWLELAVELRCIRPST